MAEGDIPTLEKMLKLPSLAGLQARIGEIQYVDLPLVAKGDEGKIGKLKKEIEDIIALPEEKEDLKMAFDGQIIHVFGITIGALLAERQLRALGKSGEEITKAKNDAQTMFGRIPNLPFFYEEERTRCTEIVHRALAQRELIPPSATEDK